MTSTSPLDALLEGHAAVRPEPLPIAGLLALAMAGFITLLTEVLPAGLLPRMSASLAVSESMAGQLITVYALGSLLTAIPLVAATQGLRRRRLLLLAIGGFAVTNTVTAISDHYVLTLAARFFAGVSGGLVWALLASYAARMVPSHLAGRAIAISGIGAPLAFSVGVPAGTFLGGVVGWRLAFGIMSALAVLLIGLVLAKVPDFPGQPAGKRLSLTGVFRIPGIRSILFVIFAFVLAHNILYTYIAPFLAPLGLLDRVDGILLVFGIGGLVGLWIAGVLIDRWLREMVLVSIVVFILAVLALAIWGGSPITVYVAVAAWGIIFGGAPALFQTASAKTAKEAADVAQAMIVTVWNLAISAAGIAGGVLLDTLGVISFPWAMIAALAPTLLVAWSAKRHGFPSVRRAGRAG
ncbi:MFS transporter [Kaistia sp. 32K]|uniref:MFS transporter n=1 Tax=Kaistia sp. 32K TaxID=2795690 RepID=UPI001915604A|nr:MFS transporter [Kaistia sp. 32K]BCP52993.1 MFS transporter [Kaistia sp. 32K]